MKRRGLVYAAGVLLILGGALMINYLGDQKSGDIKVGPPEGYEESTANDGARVEELDIGNNVSKYDNILELVTFAPGSGWVKFKTSSGISPTLSFNSVSQKDIQRFNRFSQSLGLPIRVKFSANILHLTAEGETDTGSITQKGFYQPEQQPRLVISRDQNGKVFLEEAKDGLDENDAFVAQQIIDDKKTGVDQ